MAQLQASVYQDGTVPVELTVYKTTPFGSTWHFMNSLITIPEYVISGSGATLWIAVEWDAYNEDYEFYENYEMPFFLCKEPRPALDFSTNSNL